MIENIATGPWDPGRSDVSLPSLPREKERLVCEPSRMKQKGGALVGSLLTLLISGV